MLTKIHGEPCYFMALSSPSSFFFFFHEGPLQVIVIHFLGFGLLKDGTIKRNFFFDR